MCFTQHKRGCLIFQSAWFSKEAKFNRTTRKLDVQTVHIIICTNYMYKAVRLILTSFYPGKYVLYNEGALPLMQEIFSATELWWEAPFCCSEPLGSHPGLTSPTLGLPPSSAPSACFAPHTQAVMKSSQEIKPAGRCNPSLQMRRQNDF